MNNNNTIDCIYRANAPYPPIRVDAPNQIYANEMLSNIGDVVSEMSDVCRYFYNSIVLREQFNSFAACFHHISIVEMYHLDMFAELALLLGADPRLWSGQTQKRYWSPEYISYPRDIRTLIADSIEAEEAAIYKYTQQANTISDINIVLVLERIILDEEHHVKVFNEMYNNLK